MSIKHISDLIPDDKNFNRHTERGSALVKKSLERLGFGRSILIDKNGKIIAGNLTAEEAGQMGIQDVEVIKSDGTKIIAVQRTDIDLDTPKGRELALADNRTSEVSLNLDTALIEEVFIDEPEIVEEYYFPYELNIEESSVPANNAYDEYAKFGDYVNNADSPPQSTLMIKFACEDDRNRFLLLVKTHAYNGDKIPLYSDSHNNSSCWYPVRQ